MSYKYLPYLICLLYSLTHLTACHKEYSFEGGSANDSSNYIFSVLNNDTSKPLGITFPRCKECYGADTSTAYKWSFKAGNSMLCGNVTRAVSSPDGNAMTFFGPSTCSRDSGLIITAYFQSPVLKQDQHNLTAGGASLEYYDNITTKNILQSKQPYILSLTMDSYMRATGVASGSFSGWVVDKNGYVTKIDVGKFKIKF